MITKYARACSIKEKSPVTQNENPEKKPLSELFFHIKEDGIQLKIPALSERWVEPRCYTKYPGLSIQNVQIKKSSSN